MTTYLLWFRVAPMPSCKVEWESFSPDLECAISAPTPERARDLLKAELRLDRYELAELEACLVYAADAWDASNDPEGRVRAAAESAKASDAVVFGSFGPSPPSG